MSSTIIVKKSGRRYLTKAKALIWPEQGGTCANLVQWFGCNRVSVWRQGAIVKGNTGITVGTCIATFEDGKYPNRKSGNHAAVYLKQDAEGITVHDQWEALSKPIVRKIPFKDNMSNPSNNANCFSVILTVPFKHARGYKLGYAKTGGNPATTPDSVRVIKEVIRTKHDKSVRKSLERALKDEILTYNDVKAIAASARDGKGYTVYEIRALKIILNRAQTLDGKSRTLLDRIVKKHG